MFFFFSLCWVLSGGRAVFEKGGWGWAGMAWLGGREGSAIVVFVSSTWPLFLLFGPEQSGNLGVQTSRQRPLDWEVFALRVANLRSSNIEKAASCIQREHDSELSWL